MGILIKAGVDDHGLRSRKSIAQTSTSNEHTATATTYKQAYSNGRTATATTYNDERNPRKEGFRAMRDPRRRRSTCTHRERRRARTSPPWRSPFSSPTPWQEVASHWQEVASIVGLKMEGAFRSTAMTR